MAKLKAIQEEISGNRDLNLLTRSYQEHAIQQINFARNSVLSSREFSDDLTNVFFDVKSSYRKNVLELSRKTDGKTGSFTKKNGKDVLVLISANNTLYGEIISKICKMYYEVAEKSDPKKTDFMIVGRQGRNFMEQKELRLKYSYYDIPDSSISIELLKPLAQALLNYERVLVFYGKFNNIVSQDAIEAYLSGDLPEEEKKEDTKKEEKHNFLFEPSLYQVLVFFEKQIFSLLLNQTVQEAQLARYASRINAMEKAQTNIRKILTLLNVKKKLLRNMEMNKQQLELLSGRKLWGARK